MQLCVNISQDSFSSVKLAVTELGISEEQAVSFFIECTKIFLFNESEISHPIVPAKVREKLEAIRVSSGDAKKMEVFVEKLKISCDVE